MQAAAATFGTRVWQLCACFAIEIPVRSALEWVGAGVGSSSILARAHTHLRLFCPSCSWGTQSFCCSVGQKGG